MNNLKRWFPILIIGGLVVVLLVAGLTLSPVLAQGPGGMMGGYGRGGMMNGSGFNGTPPDGYGPGWMRGTSQGFDGNMPCGSGSMMGFGPGGTLAQGMMGSASPLFETEPLTVAEATEAVNSYLAELNDPNLKLEEIMIFDNHAYAEIVEQDTGIGAMEVLVDPTTSAVYPEMGPNMMWNLKYGMMAGFGPHGMMGGFGFNNRPGRVATEISAEMPITPAQAVEAAQTYLDTYLANNLQVDEQAEPFYGYYTLHVDRNGETIGMLSVNGYSGQVFLHTWHGDLVEMSEAHEG
jgi:hypothetical protein